MNNSSFKTSNNPLADKSFQLALDIVNLSQAIVKSKKEFVLSKQILRSGTNPGAMVREAAHAQSGKDFIHKLEIAQKELNETNYWLKLLLATDNISKSQFDPIYKLANEVKRMIRASIITKKKNLKCR